MKVQKGNPEEQAVLDNIASLVEELRAMGAADSGGGFGMGPGANGYGPDMGGQGDLPREMPESDDDFDLNYAGPEGEGEGGELPEEGDEPRRAVKADGGDGAFGRTEDPQNDTTAEGPTARRPAMQNARQIRKAENGGKADQTPVSIDSGGEGHTEYSQGEDPKPVAKSVQATPDGGTEAGDDANSIIFDDLPESTQENLKEIQKSLGRLGLTIAKAAPASPVAKSMGGHYGRLEQKVDYLAGVVGEMLEGMRVAKSVEGQDPGLGELPAQVRKSQGRPAASYEGIGAPDLAEALRDLLGVKKSQDQEEADDPWARGTQVHKSMQDFTGGFGQLARGIWGGQG